MQFRRYYKFQATDDQGYAEGVCFYNKAGHQIVNFPKQHSRNLTDKHASTGEWLKPSIRILKNLRCKLVEDGHIQDGIAPSYFLEGLLYNVPDDKFTTSYGACFVAAVNWIQSEADKDTLVCANRQYYLRRDEDPNCWQKGSFDRFLSAAIELWNNG